MLTVSLGLSTWSPVSLRPLSEWESNCEKQSCQGWPFIFKSSVFKSVSISIFFYLCFNALYSSAKRFLDTLSILHNLRYYHNISADKVLCHYVCVLLRKKPKKQVCEPDKAVHVRKGAWTQNIRNASFRKLFFSPLYIPLILLPWQICEFSLEMSRIFTRAYAKFGLERMLVTLLLASSSSSSSFMKVTVFWMQIKVFLL